jgi:hypothetical protein
MCAVVVSWWWTSEPAELPRSGWVVWWWHRWPLLCRDRPVPKFPCACPSTPPLALWTSMSSHYTGILNLSLAQPPTGALQEKRPNRNQRQTDTWQNSQKISQVRQQRQRQQVKPNINTPHCTPPPLSGACALCCVCTRWCRRPHHRYRTAEELAWRWRIT